MYIQVADTLFFDAPLSMRHSLLFNARIATMRNGRYNLIEDGCLAVQDERIAWVGACQ